MFKKKASPSINTSSNEDRRSVSQSLRTPPGQHRRQIEPRRQPDTQIGIGRLLEAYDDYPRLVQDLETAISKMEIAEEQAHLAENQREEIEQELMAEKEGRKADGVTAKKEKADAEIAREKKIRGELEPKITDLTSKLKEMTNQRDKLSKELNERRNEMTRWITSMEKIQKERSLIEERENKAIEERKKVDEKLKELDTSILEGLREAAKSPEERTQGKSQTVDQPVEPPKPTKPPRVSPWA